MFTRFQVLATANDLQKCEGQGPDEHDLDYEELNALSSFYAENEEVNVTAHKTDRMPEASSHLVKGSDNGKHLPCQLCSAALRRYASLRRHYITIHGYDASLALTNVSQLPRDYDDFLFPFWPYVHNIGR